MKVVFRFLGLLRGQLAAALLGIFVSVIASGSSIALMATSGWFITAMGIAGASAVVLNIFIPSAMIRMFALFRTLLRYVDRYVSHDATFKIIEIFRLDLFSRAINLKAQEANEFKSSDIERRLRSDVDKLELAYLRQFTPIICAFIVGFIVAAWFSFYSWQIAATMFGIMLIVGVIIPICISLIMRADSINIAIRAKSLNDKASDLTFGLFDIVLMNKADIFVDRFKKDALDLAKSHARLNLAEGLNTAFLQVFTMLMLLLVLMLGCNLYALGQLNGRDTIMLGITSIAMFEVIIPLSTAFLNFENVKIAATRVFELVDNKQQEIKGGERIEGKINDIELKHVSFAYKKCKENVLEDINLHFNHNKNYILKGRSGIGKSTLISLISALNEVKEGEILANGVNYNRLDKSSIRAHLSVATQDLSLFSGTIKNIFTAIKPKIQDDEIYELLKLVELDEFVQQLPEGLNQFTGNTGVLLSGGQARRLCLARALCKQADFLLLDEPSEGLDQALEQRVINRILNLRKGIIMITHKDAGTNLADEIINLE